MKIFFTKDSKKYWIQNNNHYSMNSIQKFNNYFLQFINDIQIIDDIQHSNINIYGIQDIDILQTNNSINLLLSVENCPAWKHYNHYNKFQDYNDPNIQIYLYNHIDKLIINQKYIAIPIIYLQINYLNKFYHNIKPDTLIPFNNKKFCLIATNINNQNKKDINNVLNNIQKCDHISQFKDIIQFKSCYHSIELLNLFNQYKFVFVSENSINDGYITEKIFNCFFSRVIPIYYGSNKINYYFNQNTFINANNNREITNQINQIINNEQLYNTYLNKQKINYNYDDENFIHKVQKNINLLIK